MFILKKTQELSNSEQYLIVEWLDASFSRTQDFETTLENESLSL
ncbi:hypothetical protein [Mesoplasma photuris]|nr:hypothetical protein [Mesoplasma photuris]